MNRIVFQLILNNEDIWEVRLSGPHYDLYLNDKLVGPQHMSKAMAIYHVLASSDKFFLCEN